MSQIIETKLGRFRRVMQGEANPDTFLFECPGCKQWAYLDEDQWAGRISVDHAADGCPGRYHETHEFRKELIVVIGAKVLMDECPYVEDEL